MNAARVRRLCVRGVALVAAAWIGASALLWAMQERLLFTGRHSGHGAPLAKIDRVRDETIPAEGGMRIRVAIAKPVGPPRGVIVCFGGNGEDLHSGQRWAKSWADDWEFLALYAEHPGYGDSDGEPSLASFAAAAEAAARRGRALAEGKPLVAFGNSLGSWCAMRAAASGLVDFVILRSPPSSIGDAGAHHFPWLPVRLLLRHDFDNLALAHDVHVPVLILHGDLDRTVPFDHGHRLAEALGDRASFVLAVDCDHNDVPLTRLGPYGLQIEAFLTGRARR